MHYALSFKSTCFEQNAYLQFNIQQTIRADNQLFETFLSAGTVLNNRAFTVSLFL